MAAITPVKRPLDSRFASKDRLYDLEVAVADLQEGSGAGQTLTVAVVAGAAADTNIAITGIETEDSLVSVLRLNKDATAANIDITDVTAEADITSAGNIQLTDTVTTGDTLIVHYYKVD